ncbi:hypothetical protein AHAS_Ahas13G0343000 [Arachis hypogaea]
MHQLLIELTKKIDRHGRMLEQSERRNKRCYKYLKKLINCSNPPLEEPDTSEFTSDHGREGDQEVDMEEPLSHHPQAIGGGNFEPLLLITNGTEDRANV